MYQLIYFFSLFYLRFADAKQTKKGLWNSIHRTPKFYTWAGDTFELLSIEHLSQIQDSLRISSVDRNYCWTGKNSEGKGAQIDLVLESRASRTDYLCGMKFVEGKYSITSEDEINIMNKIDAFANSKMHRKTHSTQLVIVTTLGLAKGRHSSIINHTVTLDDLFQ